MLPSSPANEQPPEFVKVYLIILTFGKFFSHIFNYFQPRTDKIALGKTALEKTALAKGVLYTVGCVVRFIEM
jgi:hypothetical protein